MFSPQRDRDDKVIPYDEPLLGTDDRVFRHINPDQHVILDENLGARRISSGAFKATSRDPLNGMSVDIERSLLAAGMNTTTIVPEGWGSVSFRVGPVRSLNLKVGSDPILPENAYGLRPNPHHGSVWGVKSSHGSKLHALVEDWLVALPGVALRGR